MSHLVLVSGEPSGQRIDLPKEGSCILGRGRDASICLRDPLVSRYHATLLLSDGHWCVEDRGSRNGTIVNGRAVVGRQRLESGDRLELGDTILIFENEHARSYPPRGDVSSSSVQEDTAFEYSVDPSAARQHHFDSESLGVLYRISSLLNVERRLTRLIPEAMNAVRESFTADMVCIFFNEANKSPLQPAHVLSDEATPKFSPSVVWHSLRSGRALCVRDTRRELPADDVLNQNGGPSHSILCAPLVHRDRPLGALLVDRKGRDLYSEPLLLLFGAIAQMVGAAVHQAKELDRLEILAGTSARSAISILPLIGVSPAVEELHNAIRRVAVSDEPVLIVGEVGTGKREVAQAIHENSPRAAGPLILFNTLATSPDRVAVALFGMVQGDESDTDTASLGVIEKAHGGTLVIENIGALSRALQTELLVYLQTLKFKRIGGTRRHLADTRLIVTNREPLDTGGADGRFDSALLKVIQKLTVAVPALRHRLEDVVDLARRLAKHFAPQADRRQPEFAPAVTHALATYRWPGNLHELRCVIERALLLAEGDTLQANHLPSDLLIQVKHAREATIAEDLDEVQIAAPA